MFRLFLYDIDGTLIRTGGAGIRAFESVFDEVFQISNSGENIHFAGRTDSSLVREMMARHGVESSEKNLRRFTESYPRWLRHWLNELNGEICGGVTEFMERTAARADAPLAALLTGNIRKGAQLKLDHFKLWKRFAFGAFGDDHEDRNQLAHIALTRGRDRLGADLHPEQILVIGDTPKDIECARAIGARVLAVTTGGASRQELKDSNPDWLVDSLAEFDW